MTNIGKIEQERSVDGDYNDEEENGSKERQGRPPRKPGSGLSTLIAWISFVGYIALVFSLKETASLPGWLKIVSIAIFAVVSPLCIRAGGAIGNAVSPQWVIASDAWGLMKERLFWWVGPRFIGAGVAAVIAVLAAFGMGALIYPKGSPAPAVKEDVDGKEKEAARRKEEAAIRERAAARVKKEKEEKERAEARAQAEKEKELAREKERARQKELAWERVLARRKELADEKIVKETVDCGGGVMLEFAEIPAGTFMMGSPKSENDGTNLEPLHQVTISKPFYIGIFEITQAQFQAVTGTNPSSQKNDDFPVEHVSWDEATGFCRLLSEKSGRTIRLPTEAEWEYACRSGTATAFNTGDALTPDQANHRFDRTIQTGYSFYDAVAPVGSCPPNAWGLYDMHGNVAEWCSDWFSSYVSVKDNIVDPRGDAFGQDRIFRGGSWKSGTRLCRSASRGVGPQETRDFIGFRVVMEPAGEKKSRVTLTLDCGNGVMMECAAIPEGTFMMGSSDKSGEAGVVQQLKDIFLQNSWGEYDETRHWVAITKPFYMGMHVVTQAQYSAVMETNPSEFRGDNLPVENVSFDEALEFCGRLSTKTGRTVRLPTEAEWEYACRAETATMFNTVWLITSDQANFSVADNRPGVTRGKTTPVGSFPPNAWGLYDMHGDVNEMCSDWYAVYDVSKSISYNPKGPSSGHGRVVRGGAWNLGLGVCRSAFRRPVMPDVRGNDIGFRVVVE